MGNDDGTIGRILTRREALTLLGAIGAGGLASFTKLAPVAAQGARPMCVARPRQTEGPYFVDTMLNRSDIRSDPSDQSVCPGARLDLMVNVSRVTSGACAPLAGALVDVWQCDHMGVYSGVRDARFNTEGKKFLRGYQVTDAAGAARFVTIYPGWYQGRTVHIHFKIRSAPSVSPGFEFTSQLYFTDEFSDRVFATAPYNTRPARGARNANDGIFRRGGAQLMLTATQGKDGYEAVFDVGVAG
jgi:protocatechuate 3,4-dioxygenase beta subunit